MKLSAIFTLGLACLACGCFTSRYRVVVSGLDSSPGGVVQHKFRLYPCTENDDGTFSQLDEENCRLIKQEEAKHPDVFSDDGEVVRIRWLKVNTYVDGLGNKVNHKSNSLEGLGFVWDFISVLSLFTLPTFCDNEYAYRIRLEFGSEKLQRLELSDRCYDFVSYNEETFSIVPPIGWLFPYWRPSDTPFYRTGFDASPVGSAENRAVLWRAVVARAAVELRKASKEIDVRQHDADLRQKKLAKSREKGEIKPVKLPNTPSGHIRPESPVKPAAISEDDIPF